MGLIQRHTRLRGILYGTVPFLTLLYAIWYWVNDHAALASWYKSLNPYFYKASTWEADLFTPLVKYSGNWWCLAALVAALVWAYINWKKSVVTDLEQRLTPASCKSAAMLEPLHLKAFLAITIIGAFISLIPHHANIYATDEVFSAVNFADLPKFQALSHYPLPNNHILFNVANHSLFFWSDDKVLTGRILSLLFYLMALCSTWLFLDKWRIFHWIKSAILLLIALQFPTWGFSFQARGYELLLLCSCVSLFNFLGYFKSRNVTFLTVHTVANVFGIMTLPTYLYWWLGLLLAACILQVIDRKIDWAFVRASYAGFAWSMVLALPMLCFSGLGALADNRYVQGGDQSFWQFLSHINEQHYFNGLFAEWYGAGQWSFLIAIIFMALPILFFIYPKKNSDRKTLGITFYSIFLAFITMAGLMTKLPFYRNLIAHGYLALLMPVLAILPLFNKKSNSAILAILLFLSGIGFAINNLPLMPQNLYYYDIAGELDKMKRKEIEVNMIEPIYLDDEGFYWWYALQEKFPEHQLKILVNRPKPMEHPDKLHFPLPSDSTIYQEMGE